MTVFSSVRETIKPNLAAVAASVVVILVVGGLMIYRFGGNGLAETGSLKPAATADIEKRMHGCVHDVLELLGETHPQMYYYKDVWNICIHEIYSADSLVDFDIRREKLLRQELDERVLLWMVVIVTMSGVVLAAWQLYISYRLALLARVAGPTDATQVSASAETLMSPASELTFDQGHLALRSSVTGLFILAFSLAFFVIYVKWIYPTQEVAIAGPDVSQVPTGRIVGTGQLEPTAPSPAPGVEPKP